MPITANIPRGSKQVRAGVVAEKIRVPHVAAEDVERLVSRNFLHFELTNNAFLVDVYVHRDENGEPKAYYVTNVHRIIPLGTSGA
jgi:hypothetical protein